MNNIYKVIWSKAKNCYVVASEIARSHTKSASGSEKIGGGTRRSLLASLMALSLLCGGLGVASAADSVKVDVSTNSTTEVYTKEGTESYVQKNTYTKSQTYTQEQVKKLINDLKTGDVATNKANITALDGKTAGLSADGKSLNGMNSVDTVALNVTGGISNGAGVTTTLTDIKASMDKAKANETAIGELQGTTNGQQTAIDELKQKTKQISYADGDGTSISGVTIKDGNIIGNNNSTITGLTNVETGRINGKNLANTAVATEKEVNDEKTAREKKDNELEGEITKNSQDIATLDEKGVKYDDATVKDKITLAGLDGTTITRLKDATLTDSSTDAVTGRQLNQTNKNLATEKTERENKDNELDGKITTLDGKVTTDINELKAKDTDLANKIQTNAADIQTNKNAIAATDKRTGGITRNDAATETKIEGHVTVDNLGNVTAKGNVTADGKLKGEGVDAGTGAITTTGAVNAGSLIVENASTLKGNVTMNQKLSVTGDTSLGKTDVGGALNVTGESNLQGNVILGKNTANTVTVNGKSDFKEAVEMDNGLTVTSGDTTLKGKLTVTDDAELKNTTVGGTLGVTGETTLGGTLTAEKDATFEKNVTVQKDLTVDGKLNVDKISMKNDELKNGKKHDSATTITADEISNLAKVTEQGNTTESQFTHNEKGTFNYAKDEKSTNEWKRATSNVTADGVSNKMTDSDGNTHTYYQTATETKEQLVNGDKSKSNFEKKTAKGNTISITEKDADGNLKSSLTNTQTVNGEKTSVTNEDSSSTINQGADQIRYNVTSKDENKTSSSIEVKADGITNTSKDGTITNTAKNVTNEGTESVTNKVGANEVKVSQNGVDIKAEAGKKITESVGTASRFVENDKITDKAGDSTVTTENGKGTTFGKVGSTGTTNIYGDSIKTGTINAEDTTTGKLTAGAAADADGGRLTVDADGVKGSYKSGDYTSRSYILANTLMSGVDNGKKPTAADFVGSRTDHYMDGNNAKLDETVKDAAGSNVTNKTSTGTVTTITDGNTNTTTKTEQGVKDITNTAKDGTITNDAKDIVNNAQKTITNTAGTSITNQVKDSKVTTDASGTTFENKTAAVSDSGTTTTKINGNLISTGRVDANELGVSDKDGTNTAEFSVNAGEGVKASAGNGTTTGSLDVTADEVKTEVKDDSTGKHTNTSQTADGIKGYATDKDGNKTYTKVTATENSFQVQDKNGENTNHQVNTKDKSENTITNGTKANTVTSTADGTTFKNSGAAAPVTGASGDGTEVNTTIKGNTITTGKVTMDYAKVMKDLGVTGNAKVGKNLEVTGKTTTGSLEVTGTSTLNGEVIMGSNATVGNNLTVNGTTKTKTLNVTEDAEVGRNLVVRGNATIDGDVSAKSYSVEGKTYISADGINANNQKITNVADGSISEGSKDAVNGGQLYGMKMDLEHKVDKVGANAAAMANLHPMEFDPDSKWNIAAAMGNYGSETATAIGAFYRPNEDVMVNFSTAFGTGENMVGGGVSVRLGKGSNKLSREESNALKDQVDDLTARMDALLSVLNPNMSKDFPDVPENHWAYEAVSRLAGNDIVQGYPDGEFHGDRTMTRYEMAEIIYNALSRGAEAERELVEEFKPELQAMAASEKATAEKAEG